MKSRLTVAALLAILLGACSSNDDSTEPNGDHVWKSQTDTIDKARKVEGEIMKAFDKRNKSMDDQTQ